MDVLSEGSCGEAAARADLMTVLLCDCSLTVFRLSPGLSHTVITPLAAVSAGGAEASGKGLCEGRQWSSD